MTASRIPSVHPSVSSQLVPRAGMLLCALLFAVTASAQYLTHFQQQDLLDAAKAGDPAAKTKLGAAYAEGWLGQRNYEQANSWLTSASSSSSEAKARLGELYLYGRGVKADPTRGYALVLAAAQAKDPVGLRLLGSMYQNGVVVKGDLKRAERLYRSAVMRGDPQAYDALALMYFKGLGVTKNVPFAARYWLVGAQRGDQWSQLHLGELYESEHAPTQIVGGLFPKDYALYSESARSGNRIAAYRLGMMLMQGKHVLQDPKQARGYFGFSSRKGYGPATFELGTLYQRGLGVAADPVQAYTLFKLALQQGNTDAQASVALLQKQLTAAQQEDGDTRLSTMLGSRQQESPKEVP